MPPPGPAVPHPQVSPTDRERPGLGSVAAEIRFAVVMYGGVSLAIYMNGISQELLRLVRATGGRIGPDGMPAAPPPFGELRGTEGVYRKLSAALSDPGLRAAYRSWAAQGGAGPDPLRASAAGDPEIRTRFVIDVLSGTSAGGINAVFLAKALAGDLGMERLKELWVTEGDVDLLLNDRRSVRGTRLEPPAEPASLLNSQRMYLKLLEALDGMDDAPARETGQPRPARAAPSPYVEELDLAVTATDIRGTVIPIRLADGIVHERSHRKVFRFRYAAPWSATPVRNDFQRSFNPFLAFAARCTSSFPFAFEPMRLEDVDGVLRTLPGERGHAGHGSGDPRWSAFFDSADGVPEDYRTRSLGDGGYLDNKPFSHAVAALARRHADVPVKRKLVYIEPAPEHPEERRDPAAPPDALENVGAALVGIPRYETIREDVEAVLRRNRRIDRIARITERIERDLANVEHEGRPPVLRGQWNDLSMSEMARLYGRYYLPYRRLRIAAVTDDVARAFAAGARARTEEEVFAIRRLVRAWRKRHFANEPVPPHRSVNGFLDEFDLSYRLRRLGLVRRRLGEVLDLLAPSAADERARPVPRGLAEAGLDPRELDAPEAAALRRALLALERELNGCHRTLRGLAFRLESVETAREVEELRAKVARLGLGRDHLAHLLGEPGKFPRPPPEAAHDGAGAIEPGVARALDMLAHPDAFGLPPDFAEMVDGAARALREILHAELKEGAGARARALLDPATPLLPAHPWAAAAPAGPLQAARAWLYRFYAEFEQYDQISFPILYDTDTGEPSTVDVVRFSPEDATSIVDERAEGERRRKLAGTALGNFGAFLDRVWRKNDLMWGRLDGAERLVATLLPDEADRRLREDLRREAQVEILREEMGEEARGELDALLAGALVRAAGPRGEAIGRAVDEVLARSGVLDAHARLEALLRSALGARELLGLVKSQYEVDRKVDPKTAFRTISRAARIAGKMMDGIAEARIGRKAGGRWLARAGQVLAAAVEVAVPRSWAELLFRHALKLVYLFAGLLVAAGLLFGSGEVKRAGWATLGGTALAHVVVLLVGDRLRGRSVVSRLLAWAAGAGVVALAAVGLDRVAGLGLVDAALDVLRRLPLPGGRLAARETALAERPAEVRAREDRAGVGDELVPPEGDGDPGVARDPVLGEDREAAPGLGLAVPGPAEHALERGRVPLPLDDRAEAGVEGAGRRRGERAPLPAGHRDDAPGVGEPGGREPGRAALAVPLLPGGPGEAPGERAGEVDDEADPARGVAGLVDPGEPGVEGCAPLRLEPGHRRVEGGRPGAVALGELTEDLRREDEGLGELPGERPVGLHRAGAVVPRPPRDELRPHPEGEARVRDRRRVGRGEGRDGEREVPVDGGPPLPVQVLPGEPPGGDEPVGRDLEGDAVRHEPLRSTAEDRSDGGDDVRGRRRALHLARRDAEEDEGGCRGGVGPPEVGHPLGARLLAGGERVGPPGRLRDGIGRGGGLGEEEGDEGERERGARVHGRSSDEEDHAGVDGGVPVGPVVLEGERLVATAPRDADPVREQVRRGVRVHHVGDDLEDQAPEVAPLPEPLHAAVVPRDRGLPLERERPGVRLGRRELQTDGDLVVQAHRDEAGLRLLVDHGTPS